MSNCLVTKLSEVIDNQDLLYLEYAKMTILGTNPITLVYNSNGFGKGLKVYAISGGTINNGLTEVDILYPTVTITPSASGVVILFPYIGLVNISNYSSSLTSYSKVRFDVRQLEFMPSLSTFLINGSASNISELFGGNIGDYFDKTSIASLLIPYSHATFKMESIPERTYSNFSVRSTDFSADVTNVFKSTSALRPNFAYTQATGDIEDIINTNIVDLNITACPITGDLKNLCEYLYENGRHSGTLTIWNADGRGSAQITWDGQSMIYGSGKENPVITFSENGYSNNKIV